MQILEPIKVSDSKQRLLEKTRNQKAIAAQRNKTVGATGKGILPCLNATGTLSKSHTMHQNNNTSWHIKPVSKSANLMKTMLSQVPH